MKPHIMIVSTLYPSEKDPYAGIFVKEQALALKEEGYQIGVVVPIFQHIQSLLQRRKFRYSTCFKLENTVPTFRFPILKLLPFSLVFSEYANYLFFLNSITVLVGQYIANIGKPDLIHGYSLITGGYIATLMSQILKLPLVVTEHGPSILKFRQSWNRYIMKVARRAHYLISVNHYLAQIITNVTNFSTNIVPNLVDTDFFTLRPCKANSHSKRFLTISRFEYRKGIHLLLMAFSGAFKGNNNIYLDIGGSGEQAAYLKQMVSSLGIENQVTFLGQLSGTQVRGALHSADVFVLPSLPIEPYGGILVEAMATGLPIITTRSGVPQEVLSSARLGLLVAHGNVLELKNALINILDDIECKKYDQRFIRDYTIQNYGKQAVITKLNEIYTRVLR